MLHFTVMARSEMRFEMLAPSQFSSAPEIVHNENSLRLKKKRKNKEKDEMMQTA